MTLCIAKSSPHLSLIGGAAGYRLVCGACSLSRWLSPVCSDGKCTKVQRQRCAVSKIEEAGGTVHYKSDPPFGLRALEQSGFFDYVVAVRLNGRDIKDVSYLADLPTIEDLSLSGTKVTDLSPLAALSQLKRLSLLAVPVRDIHPLSDLTKLESLSLENTQVADVSPLAKLVNLRDLSLAGTPVGDLSCLQEWRFDRTQALLLPKRQQRRSILRLKCLVDPRSLRHHVSPTSNR